MSGYKAVKEIKETDTAADIIRLLNECRDAHKKYSK